MFITDAHCDTLRAIAVSNMDYAKLMVTPQRLKDGGVALQTFAMFSGVKGMAGTPYEDGMKMLGAIDKLEVPVFRTKLPDAPPEEPCGIISIEGGEMLKGSLDVLVEMDSIAHIRLIALTWNNINEIGHPAKDGPEGHLTDFGFSLLKEMDSRGILADVSHLNETGFWDIVENAELPPVASHSNCRWLRDVPRNLKKEQVQAIIDKNGFIGMNFYTAFLTDNDSSTLEDVFRHIDAVCEMGGEKILGFGSDFDGIESWPEGLSHPGEFGNLINVMREHGYDEEAIADIAGRNFWRLLKSVE